MDTSAVVPAGSITLRSALAATHGASAWQLDLNQYLSSSSLDPPDYYQSGWSGLRSTAPPLSLGSTWILDASDRRSVALSLCRSMLIALVSQVTHSSA